MRLVTCQSLHGAKFANRHNAALHDLDMKRHSVQAIRSLIQIEVKTYRALPLIHNLTSDLLVQHVRQCSWVLKKKSNFIDYIPAVTLASRMGEPHERGDRLLIRRRE